jgi:hypothetical protein
MVIFHSYVSLPEGTHHGDLVVANTKTKPEEVEFQPQDAVDSARLAMRQYTYLKPVMLVDRKPIILA